MACTVKKLAALSGVSVRTLHFYDELGLLKPAFVAANGYRFYEEAQLLQLQQILFYRELGFELKQIREILGQRQFDRVQALRSHRQALSNNLERTRALIATIDQTIEHLEGKRKMKSKSLFAGFDPKEQARHEQYLVERYGPKMEAGIEQSKKRVQHWTKADWEKSGAEFNAICHDLVGQLQRKRAVESAEVQEVIGRHFRWLSRFWTPNRESYAGHSRLIVDSDLRKAYAAHDPALPEFLARGIQAYAAQLD